ncbi:MAG: AlbA family DNA-binding domain-containing protein [Candidatus Syntropharchaeia archaeon]
MAKAERQTLRKRRWIDGKKEIWKYDCIIGLANKNGGYFVIGFDDDKNLVYANNIDSSSFKDQVEKWIDSFVDPRGLLDKQIKLISDDNGQCIIIYVNSKPGVCFARRKEGREKGVTSYFFPYRIGGSTKKLNFEEFFKIYVQKFLESLAVSSELIKKEEEKMPPIRVREISEEEKPFNSELVNSLTPSPIHQ